MPRKEPFDVCRGSLARDRKSPLACPFRQRERERGGREEEEGVVCPPVRPPFEEMGALNVKKWSAAASVAESEDLMDCSMSHVGGGREGGKRQEGRGPQERPERVKLNGLAEVAPSPSLPIGADTRYSSKIAIFPPERLTTTG